MIRLTIYGEPASKANSRELATIGAKKMDVVVGREEDGRLRIEQMKVGGRIMNRKSDKALAYEENALRQIPPLARIRLQGPVRVTLRVFYASERPDLDESVILDVLQDRYVKNPATKQRELVQRGVYLNDRQVREKHVYHAIDRKNPRAEIEVEEITPGLVLVVPEPDVELEAEPF